MNRHEIYQSINLPISKFSNRALQNYRVLPTERSCQETLIEKNFRLANGCSYFLWTIWTAFPVFFFTASNHVLREIFCKSSSLRLRFSASVHLALQLISSCNCKMAKWSSLLLKVMKWDSKFLKNACSCLG